MTTHLLNVPLNELRTNDEQKLGSVYTVGGKAYRWVKNLGSTNLTAGGPALIVHAGATVGNIMHKVISPDAGVATAIVSQPAGSCVTGICATGSATGSYGWVQVKGEAIIKQQQLSTPLAAGSFSIASSSYNGAWASNHSGVHNTATAVFVAAYAKKVELLQGVATTGAATAASVVASIHCL